MSYHTVVAAALPHPDSVGYWTQFLLASALTFTVCYAAWTKAHARKMAFNLHPHWHIMDSALMGLYRRSRVFNPTVGRHRRKAAWRV